MSVTAKEVAEACAGLSSEATDLGPSLRRGIRVREEFDCRNGCAFGNPKCNPDSGGYHGIGSRRVLFYVTIQGKGGVGFDLHSPIYAAAAMDRHPDILDHWTPMGSVDIHLAVEPSDSWMTRVEGECVVAGTQDGCWCDGTSLQAETGASLLVEGGKEAVWAWLAEVWLPEVLERSLAERSEP